MFEIEVCEICAAVSELWHILFYFCTISATSNFYLFK
jgi:hypothetical protein